MKKLLCCALSFAMLFTMAACGKTPASSASQSTSGEELPENTINYGLGVSDDGYYTDVDVAELVSLPDDYKNIVLSKDDVTPTEDDWNYFHSSIAAQAGTKDPGGEDAVAELGKYVSVDFTGSLNGEDFVGGSGTGVEMLLGSGMFLEDLENGIVGHVAGDMFSVDVTFPEDYGQTTNTNGDTVSLSGMTAQFSVVVNEVYDYSLSNEQIASYFETINTSLGDTEKVTDEASMRAYFDKTMLETNIENAAVEQLSEKLDFEVPQTLIDDYVEVELEIAELNASATGYDLEEYLNLSGYATQDEFEDYVANTALPSIRTRCVLLAVAKAENLQYDDEACVEAFGHTKDILKEVYRYSDGYVIQNVLCVKAADVLADTAVVK